MAFAQRASLALAAVVLALATGMTPVEAANPTSGARPDGTSSTIGRSAFAAAMASMSRTSSSYTTHRSMGGSCMKMEASTKATVD